MASSTNAHKASGLMAEILAAADAKGLICGNIRKEGDRKVSTHFTAAEFACPDCGEYKIHVKLLEGLEMIRTKLGAPMRIVNPAAPGGQGYRCMRYALSLAARHPHASPRTKHNDGTAADINAAFSKTTSQELFKLAEAVPQFKNGGIGIYSWGIHVDLGPKRRWKY